MLLSHIIITSEIVSAQPKSVLSYVSETFWKGLLLLPLRAPGEFLGQSPQFLSLPQEGIWSTATILNIVACYISLKFINVKCDDFNLTFSMLVFKQTEASLISLFAGDKSIK